MPKPPLPARYDELLTEPNPAVIGTLTPAGTPSTVATWYLWEDGRVLVNMDQSRKRIEHLRHDPHVSLTVFNGRAWNQHVSLRGRVVSLDGDSDLTDINRISTHYIGRPYPDQDRARVSAWIEVLSWHVWGFEPGG